MSDACREVQMHYKVEQLWGWQKRVVEKLESSNNVLVLAKRWGAGMVDPLDRNGSGWRFGPAKAMWQALFIPS